MLAKTIEQRKNPGCTVEVSVGRWFTRITTHAHVRGQAGGGHNALLGLCTLSRRRSVGEQEAPPPKQNRMPVTLREILLVVGRADRSLFRRLPGVPRRIAGRVIPG